MNWCCDPSAAWKQVQTISITYGQEGKGFSDYLPTRWIYDEYKLERTTANKLDPRLLTTIASHEPTENSILSYGGTWNNPLTAIYSPQVHQRWCRQWQARRVFALWRIGY